jgi:hypothetical protein
VFSMIFRRKASRTPRSTWKFRLGRCRKCDIYDPVNRTCGDNKGVIEVNGTLYPNGCSCLVGLRASDPKADCFLVSCKVRSKWQSLSISVDGETDAGDIDLRGGLR